MTSPTRIPGRGFLHSPGPTHVPDEVLDAMNHQPVDLVDPRLTAALADVEVGLKRLSGTTAGELFLYASNGHGAWEAVVENLLPVGGAVLIPGTGVVFTLSTGLFLGWRASVFAALGCTAGILPHLAASALGGGDRRLACA